MRDAIRNIRDLLINPYRTFMRINGQDCFNICQYILYVLSILTVVGGKSEIGIFISLICISISSFLMAIVYQAVARGCGGKISYWRSLNAQVCMSTLANIGNLFDVKNVFGFGGSISFSIHIYCIYLHILGIIVLGRTMVKRTIIVYVTLFIIAFIITYICYGILAGVIINERGYIS